jgi:hypothetical protein
MAGIFCVQSNLGKAVRMDPARVSYSALVRYTLLYLEKIRIRILNIRTHQLNKNYLVVTSSKRTCRISSLTFDPVGFPEARDSMVSLLRCSTGNRYERGNDDAPRGELSKDLKRKMYESWAT